MGRMLSVSGYDWKGLYFNLGASMDKLYSVADAAERMGGINKWTVEAWLSKGRLKRTKVGRRTMVGEAEIPETGKG